MPTKAELYAQMAESGDALAKQVWEAFFYQIAKDAGAMAAVLHGKGAYEQCRGYIR